MPGRASRFPDPRRAPADGPLAMGGDLEPATLLDAYRHGIFPWPADIDGLPLLWWSPDPRAVFLGAQVHASRTVLRRIRSGTFRITRDEAFDAVVEACADRTDEGTWITAEMARAYGVLHRLGHAHSVEVWDADGRLVGGVYGVSVGAVFCGESMFHRATDASKVALVELGRHLGECGFVLLDAQLPTPHLASLGAVEMPRSEYLATLATARDAPVTWRDDCDRR